MKEKFILVLPDIRSAHNVGAMFRTADGAGVDKICLTGFMIILVELLFSDKFYRQILEKFCNL